MLKILINEEEVVSNKDFTINKEILNTPSVILNNIYPKTWEQDKDYVSRFYHPNDYSKCKILDETYIPPEEGTTVTSNTGEIYITDADNTKEDEYQVQGKCEQDTYTGKNLYGLTVATGTSLGVTRSLLGSEILLNGTTNGSGNIYNDNTKKIILQAGTYTFSSKILSGTRTPNSKDTAIYLMKVADSSVVWYVNSGNNYEKQQTITFAEETELFLRIYTNGSGFVFNNLKIGIQVEKGSTATSYEPYVGGIASPNPDYPQEVKTVSGIGNLFDKDNANILNANLNVTNIGASSNAKTLYIQCKPNTTYTISKIQSSRFRVATTAVLPAINGSVSQFSGYETDSNTTYTITTNSTANYLCIYYYLTGTDTLTEQEILDSIQIEKCSTAHQYVPYGHWLPIKVANSNDTSAQDYQEQTTLIDLNKYNSNNEIIGNYELCSIGENKDLLTIKDSSAIITKNIDKIILNGSESYTQVNVVEDNIMYRTTNAIFVGLPNNTTNYITNYFSTNTASYSSSTIGSYIYNNQFRMRVPSSVTNIKTWLATHNTNIYYKLSTSQTITLKGTYNISLYEGTNYITIYDDNLIPTTQLHYNYKEEEIISDLLFCGVVKNSGNISLNPRHPHYSTLQILDFKTFLSEGELDTFVISNKTILEAIEQIISSISSYGFILGNINILNPNEIIGAYSTKDKSAYDVFNYIADITQSRWTTRLIDENSVAIDFYDPTLMEQGITIDYTQEFFKKYLIDDIDYSYGTNDYRNKQVMTSSQVYSNISQTQSIVADGYQTQFQTEQPIGQILSITSNGSQLSFATNNEKELGFTADFYYTPGNNYIESADLRSTGEVLQVEYISLVEGRQIITNPSEIQRISTSTGRKGVVTRYENRNDAINSNELQSIGESYIKYKGVPEIVLSVKSRSNIWKIGQKVQFNAPIDELNTEYMVRSKKINYIATVDIIFYTYELTSSFNSETAINYFDNQRAKANGNIGEGEYISRNVDIESNANIIFYDTQISEITLTGDNSLNSVLNAPFIN